MIVKSDNKRINLINAIEEYLEDFGYKLNEWEAGFLEDIQKRLKNKIDLTQKQYNKLTDIIGFNFLK
jgi:hypothetical protein